MSQKRSRLLVVLVAFILTAAACGDGSDPAPGPSPTPTPPTTPTTPTPGGTTFTITSTGVSPRTLTVPAGTRVTFVNNDNAPTRHDLEPSSGTHGLSGNQRRGVSAAVGQTKHDR